VKRDEGELQAGGDHQEPHDGRLAAESQPRRGKPDDRHHEQKRAPEVLASERVHVERETGPRRCAFDRAIDDEGHEVTDVVRVRKGEPNESGDSEVEEDGTDPWIALLESSPVDPPSPVQKPNPAQERVKNDVPGGADPMNTDSVSEDAKLEAAAPNQKKKRRPVREQRDSRLRGENANCDPMHRVEAPVCSPPAGAFERFENGDGADGEEEVVELRKKKDGE
jgi:hypothetical protein